MMNFVNKQGMGFIIFALVIVFSACKVPQVTLKEVHTDLPEFRQNEPAQKALGISQINWKDYFKDPQLTAIIDTALRYNQELNIFLQELSVMQSEVREKSGEYLPFINLGSGLGAEKPGRFTRDGAVEHSLEIEEGRHFPEPLGDFEIRAIASWEIDLWKKLRNAKDIAQFKYLANNEAKGLLISNLVSEIATSYYELMALDQLLKIINANASIQKDALRKVRLLKENAKANQLSVNRFEAQLLKTKNLQYEIKQRIVETENEIHVLSGRYPQQIQRNEADFMLTRIDSLSTGVASDLLRNRPDIRQAEYNLKAAALNIEVARADFFPQVEIEAGIGFQAFNPKFLFNPESILFGALGSLSAPLVNKRAIRANFDMATANQIQSAVEYEQTILNAYTDVLNQLNRLDNYSNSLRTKQTEVDLLNRSVRIANNLFQYGKADYIEVLLTQEEVLDAKMELVETKLQQLKAKVQLYRALGGGWQNPRNG